MEGGLIELIVDGLILLVVDETMQDASFLGRVLGLVVALEELLLGRGQVDLPLERVLRLVFVAGDGLGLEVHEVEVVIFARSTLVLWLLVLEELVTVVFERGGCLLQLSP